MTEELYQNIVIKCRKIHDEIHQGPCLNDDQLGRIDTLLHGVETSSLLLLESETSALKMNDYDH